MIDRQRRRKPDEEKALEYQLVDLMTEAAERQDVMQAIVTLITFLKTKDRQTCHDQPLLPAR